MKTDYSVSWDEYLNLCRPYLPKPDWAWCVAAVLMAVGLGIVAVAVDWLARGRSLATMLLVCAVGIVINAFWSASLGTLIRRGRYVKQCRTMYRERFGATQSFMFDDQKWANKSRPEDGEVFWHETTNANEYEHSIVLQSAKSFALLPKRVLAPAALTNLRQLTFGEFDTPLILKVGLRDYVQAEIRSLWKRRTSPMAWLHIVGIVTAAAMLSSLRKPHVAKDVFWVLVLSGSLLLITAMTQVIYFVIRYATQWRRRYQPWELEYSDRGIHLRAGRYESFIGWSMLPRFEETKRAFLLFVDNERYYILPKRSLKSELQDTFRQMLRSKEQFA